MASDTTVLGSIVAGNRKSHGPSDCPEAGGIASLGHNVWGDSHPCPTNGTGDRYLGTPGLGNVAYSQGALALAQTYLTEGLERLTKPDSWHTF